MPEIEAESPGEKQCQSTPTRRPNFGSLPIVKESIATIGRKKIAHEISGDEIHEYLGFGMIAARATVRRVLSFADAETAAKWRPLEQQVVASLAEFPPIARLQESAAELVFGLWVDLAANAKHLGDEAYSWRASSMMARMLMKRALPEEIAKHISDELPSDAPPPAFPELLSGPGDYEDLEAMFAKRGPIVDAARVGQHLMMIAARGAGALADHPDGLISSVGSLLCTIGHLLIQYDPSTPDLGFKEDRDAGIRKLRALVEAAERSGLDISHGSQRGIPDRDNIAWCARQVRAALAEIDFLDLPAYKDRAAEPSIQEDVETLAKAFETRWQQCTYRPSPVTGLPSTSAVRDMLFKLDGEWSRLDPSEKARQLVMAYLGKAGVKKPSRLFDAERKKEARSDQSKRPNGRQQ